MIRPGVAAATSTRLGSAQVAAVRVAAQAGDDAAQLRARHAHALERVAGELERRLGLRVGEPADTQGLERRRSRAARGRATRSTARGLSRSARSAASRAVSGSPMVTTRTRARSRPSALEDLRVGRIAEHRRRRRAARPSSSRRASRSTTTHRKPRGAHGRDDDPADPAGAQHDDRRAGAPPRRWSIGLLRIARRRPAASAGRPRPRRRGRDRRRPRPAPATPGAATSRSHEPRARTGSAGCVTTAVPG